MVTRNEKEMVKHIVDLWYETQMGHYLKCKEKNHKFQDLMWGLYEELNGEDNGK